MCTARRRGLLALRADLQLLLSPLLLVRLPLLLPSKDKQQVQRTVALPQPPDAASIGRTWTICLWVTVQGAGRAMDRLQ
jgi:hypothetical protein